MRLGSYAIMMHRAKSGVWQTTSYDGTSYRRFFGVDRIFWDVSKVEGEHNIIWGGLMIVIGKYAIMIERIDNGKRR